MGLCGVVADALVVVCCVTMDKTLEVKMDCLLILRGKLPASLQHNTRKQQHTLQHQHNTQCPRPACLAFLCPFLEVESAGWACLPACLPHCPRPLSPPPACLPLPLPLP